MEIEIINIDGVYIKVYSLNTVIVGSGAAGFNAADSLYSLGQHDIALVTEGINMGTSRNTGSDKQTYYKLTLSGDTADSTADMAQTLFDGGCMHGDIALAEAAMSPRCFFKLVDIGVPFPHNHYGEYIGYKTDHDPKMRATSCGPLTSRIMTEKLEENVKRKGIAIFDGFQVICILTKKEKNVGASAIGLIALNKNELNEPHMGFTLFNFTNIIYATGGPAGVYLSSVYPESQTGASGIAYEAGAKGINLTESQYGIASVKFRWNLSGTYQQVIPRYVSTNQDGSDEREFLNDFFENPATMLNDIFLKGYQWPFDPRKINGFGSSIIDILVYNETQIRGRRVFLDFMHNPGWSGKNNELDFSLLNNEAYTYLQKSGALFGTPLQRLQKMNQPAINLYMNNGIDLSKEYLEIAVCAQHNNGGLVGNIWWESNLRHFFPVGEVNGTFGVYRPGGSALNSTQVGSLRAAQYINANYRSAPLNIEDFINISLEQVKERIQLARKFASKMNDRSNIIENRKIYQARMTKAGAHIRSLDHVNTAISECRGDLTNLIKNSRIGTIKDLPDAFINRDILITQLVYLSAIKEYIEKGGRSRGSYLIRDNNGELPVPSLPEEFRYSLETGELMGSVCETWLTGSDPEWECHFSWSPVRPIPHENYWFENTWNAYMRGDIIR
jgi:succinate dehydrogenase/fumarate reductase flavoprotein subunit